MMGGKWAYESLSFGGYWAWDPVENAALVPWLILVAGLHCMAIYNSTGNALRASFLFTILTYFFVLYSTFLTRTGILGDTSVHSFTEAGTAMNILIGIYVVGITIPLLSMFVRNYKKICPNSQGVIFCPNKEQAELIAENFRKGGFTANMIECNTKNRKQLLNDFANKKFQIITNASLLSEG